MPTSRPRHTITETPPVQEALDRLRAQIGSQRVDIPELVVLGADAKIRQLTAESPAARAAGHRLAERIRAREPLADAALADEAKRHGLIG